MLGFFLPLCRENELFVFIFIFNKRKMKRRLYLSVVSLLLMVFFVGCKDDESPVNESCLDPNKQSLTLTEINATTSTFTFSVNASDAEIPYLVLYVDKDVIDDVPKGDLPEYLMADLEKQAKDSGKGFEEFLSSVAIKGNLDEKKIEGLLSGKIYELVAFAVSGTRIADEAEYLFFQTLKADPVECKFDVSVEPDINTALLQISPSNKDINWFCGGVAKDVYDRAIAEGGYTNETIAHSIFTQQYQQIISQLVPEGGELTDEIIQEALSYLLFKGDMTLKFQNLAANTDYQWVAVAYKLVTTDDGLEIVMVSNASTGSFKTLEMKELDLTFDVKVTDVTATSAHITVTPSNLEESFIWYYDAHNSETENLSAEELMNRYIEQNRPFIGWLMTKGVQDVPNAKLLPNSKNYILVFGYNQGVTTEPVLYEYTTPAGGDPTKVEFTHTTRQAGPYQASVMVEPSDLTVPYVTNIVVDSEYNEQVNKDIIEAAIKQDYEMQLAYNPGLTMESYIYSGSMFNLGVNEIGFYDVEAATSYTVCSYAINSEGKVAALTADKGAIVTAALSDASISGQVFGYYDGDEEAGKIFGDAEKTKGRTILVMKFTLGNNSFNPRYGVMVENPELDEMNDKVCTDKFLIKNYVLWNDLSKNLYAFVLCDWEQSYYSFAYAKDDKGIEGKINRMALPVLSKEGVGEFSELEELIARLDQESKSSLRAAAVNMNSEIVTNNIIWATVDTPKVGEWLNNKGNMTYDLKDNTKVNRICLEMDNRLPYVNVVK